VKDCGKSDPGTFSTPSTAEITPGEGIAGVFWGDNCRLTAANRSIRSPHERIPNKRNKRNIRSK
jgi:hypothetical protein